MASKIDELSRPSGELEKEALEIIKQLLKKHVTFQIDANFLRYTSQNLKIPEIQVCQVIYSLVKQKLLMPGSTLTRSQILDNPSRALIMQIIKHYPGIHMRELCKRTGKSLGVVLAHLTVLENFDFIRIKKYDSPKFSLFFEKGFPEIYDDYFFIWKNENNQRIIQALLTLENNLTSLASQLLLHHSTVQYHLNRLIAIDLILRIQNNSLVSYRLNPTKVQILREFLTIIESNKSINY